jgi:hypothetical protein
MIETLTGVLVVITAFYAWITFKILKANESVLHETKLQREAFFRPYISISPVVYTENPIFFLKIQNTGQIAANNLKLSIDKDFFQFGEKNNDRNLKHYSAFSDKIDSFVPNAQMLFYLAQGFVIFGNNAKKDITPSIFTITATYEFSGKKISEQTIIDLRPYLNSAIPHDPVVSMLKGIKESIEKNTDLKK